MKAIIIYTYIIIFGGWLFKLINLPSEVGLIILQLFDYLPFLFLPWLFKVKRNTKILPNSIYFWVIVILFLILSLTTTIYHKGELMAAIAHFGALFRYTPLAALLYILKISEKDIKLFYKNFIIISVILIIIGYLEIIGGDNIKDLFLPLTKEYSSSANIKDSSSISGIFPNTVDYSYFLVISYIIISNKRNVTNQFLLFVLYLIPIYFSGSKAALIIFLLCLSFKMENIKMIRNTFIGVVGVGAAVLIYQFWELFYWTVFIDSQASRLGYIIFTLPSFIQEFSIDTLIGVSPDKTLVYQKINSYVNAPMLTWNIDYITSFEDEFYVALIVYYGLIGFSLLLFLFIGMYRAFNNVKWKDTLFNYPIIVKSLFIILVIAPLFNQIIILKPFTIFFWCWIGLIENRIVEKNKVLRLS